MLECLRVWITEVQQNLQKRTTLPPTEKASYANIQNINHRDGPHCHALSNVTLISLSTHIISRNQQPQFFTAMQVASPWAVDRCLAVARAMHCMAELHKEAPSEPVVRQARAATVDLP